MIRLRTVCRAMLLVAILAALATPAAAGMREFSGEITKIVDDSIVVRNRAGDELSFEVAEGVAVSGAKQSFSALSPGDLVTVSWRIEDSPRRAHRIRVIPTVN